MSMTQQAKKIKAGRYSYRGYTIYRDENTQAGYFGSWRVWETLGTMLHGHSLKECKNRIDRHIERINAPAKIWEDYCNEVNECRILNRAARLQNLINKCAQKMVEWPDSRDFYLKSLIDTADMLNDTTEELANLVKKKAKAKAGK